jgi:biopolymer transport protein ExbB/TolQ
MKNYINSRNTNIIISICGGFTFWVLLNVLHFSVPEHSATARILQIMGGTPLGYIQMLTYVAFLLGILELMEKERLLKNEYAGFDLRILPIEHDATLSNAQIQRLGSNLGEMEKHGETSLLASFIQKTCVQYAHNQSFNDAMQLVDTKIKTTKEASEGQLEIVRYILFAISSLGFVGTVMGLSEAIGMSATANTKAGLKAITTFFHLAFDTTLVALILNLVLNYLYHRHLERLDTFYSKSKTYIVDNLLCKIQTGG